MNLDNLVRNIVFEILSALEVSFAGEIVDFNNQKMTASVRPLLTINQQPLPILNNIPVQILGGQKFFVRPVYEKGDIVRLSVAGSVIYRAIFEKRPVEMKSIEKFLLSNCTVSGGFVNNNIPPIFSQKNGLLVGKNNSYIHFSENGIEILGNVTVTGNMSVNGNVSATDVSAGAISLLTHKHISGAAGSPTSPPTP